MAEPRLGILIQASLELEVGVLARVRSKFWEPLGFHVVNILLIHQIHKHSHDFNEGNASLNQKDRVGIISFNI